MNQVHQLKKKKARDARPKFPGAADLIVNLSAPVDQLTQALDGARHSADDFAAMMKRGAFGDTGQRLVWLQRRKEQVDDSRHRTMMLQPDYRGKRPGESRAAWRRRIDAMPPFEFPKGPKPGPARIRDNNSVNRAAWLRKENRRRRRAGEDDNGIRGFRSKHGLVQALIGGAWKTI